MTPVCRGERRNFRELDISKPPGETASERARNTGDGDLELFEVAAYVEGAKDSGRTDVSPQR